jgi:hypothetical protein
MIMKNELILLQQRVVTMERSKHNNKENEWNLLQVILNKYFFPSNFYSKPIQPLITHNTIESDNLITNYMQHITIHELFFT